MLPLGLLSFLTLLTNPFEALAYPTRIACEAPQIGKTQTFVLHWDDGLEGSMTVEWRDESFETIGFYRQPSIDLQAPQWRLLLPYQFEIRQENGKARLFNEQRQPIAECAVSG